MTAPCFALPLVSALLIGCSSTEKIELQGNQSVGDDYHCTISPKGVVREASRKYDLMPLPIAGIGGKYIFEFEAIAEGEAEITVYNNFR
ncbi:MAG: protease inhibitor I42 family protein, partial [Fibromonadaceae bacterium]|nr:protease inhibitor I42 family protein [Fibromonadaceae bacterium]